MKTSGKKQISKFLLEELLETPFKNIFFDGLDTEVRKQIYTAFLEKTIGEPRPFLRIVSYIVDKKEFELINAYHHAIESYVKLQIKRGVPENAKDIFTNLQINLPSTYIEQLCKNFKDIEHSYVGCVLSFLVTNSSDKVFNLDFSEHVAAQYAIGAFLKKGKKLIVKGNSFGDLGYGADGEIIFKKCDVFFKTDEKHVIGKNMKKHGKIIFENDPINIEQVHPSCQGEIYFKTCIWKKKTYPPKPDIATFWDIVEIPEFVQSTNDFILEAEKRIEDIVSDGTILNFAEAKIKAAKAKYSLGDYKGVKSVLNSLNKYINKTILNQHNAKKLLDYYYHGAKQDFGEQAFTAIIFLDNPSWRHIETTQIKANHYFEKGDYVKAHKYALEVSNMIKKSHETIKKNEGPDTYNNIKSGITDVEKYWEATREYR